jgi:hypothetical protein
MQLLSAGATLAFLVISALVGARLLLLARRTGAVPELALGLAFFLVGAVGHPLGLLAVLPGLSEPLSRALFALSQLSVGVGSAAVFVFTRAVFRPEERWAQGIVRIAALVLAVQTAFAVERALAGDPAHFVVPDLGFSVRQAVTAFSYAWTAVEALRYRALLVRRLAIGLAEVEVVNRFLLWAIAGAGAFAGSTTMSAVSLSGAMPWQNPLALSAVGLGGLTSAVCAWLAFMPPRAYLAWVRSGSQSA